MSLQDPRKTPAPIRTFALVCVGVTSLFLIAMVVWYTTILSGKDWCATAISVSRDAIPIIPPTATQACFSLLGQQVSALAFNSHIALGVIAMCLLALMVIVVAGGHIAFKADKTGISGNLGGGAEPVAAAADAVAHAAQDKADDIKKEVEPDK